MPDGFFLQKTVGPLGVRQVFFQIIEEAFYVVAPLKKRAADKLAKAAPIGGREGFEGFDELGVLQRAGFFDEKNRRRNDWAKLAKSSLSC